VPLPFDVQDYEYNLKNNENGKLTCESQALGDNEITHGH